MQVRCSGTFLKWLTKTPAGNSVEGYLFSGIVVGQDPSTTAEELQVLISCLDRVVSVSPEGNNEDDELLKLELGNIAVGIPFTEGLDDSGTHWTTIKSNVFGDINTHIQDLEAAAEHSYPVVESGASDRNITGGLIQGQASSQLNSHHQTHAHPVNHRPGYLESPLARLSNNTVCRQGLLQFTPQVSVTTPQYRGVHHQPIRSHQQCSRNRYSTGLQDSSRVLEDPQTSSPSQALCFVDPMRLPQAEDRALRPVDPHL